MPTTDRIKELLRQPENKTCVDCGAPSPQWASLNNCIFCCLECSGKHRGLGVHISFIRSTNMDAWKDEQVGRMELFGNEKFRQLIESSATLSQDTPIEDKYTSAEVENYREEINSVAKEKGLWMPAQSPANTRTNSDSGSQTRTRRRMNEGGPGASAAAATTTTATNENEEYFEKLGKANESRSADLPPSQGGKYTGFGNTPQPQSSTSSENVPSIDELRDNPMQAVSKGWGFFSSALGGAASAVKSTVDDRLADPNLERDLQGYRDNISSYWTQGLSRASEYSNVANEWTRKELGIDVQGQLRGEQAEGSENPSKTPDSHKGI